MKGIFVKLQITCKQWGCSILIGFFSDRFCIDLHQSTKQLCVIFYHFLKFIDKSKSS